MVVSEYLRLHDAAPRELFIHVKSAFTDAEWAGFGTGAAKARISWASKIAEARVLISPPMDSEPKLPFKSTFEAEKCLRLERAGEACGVCGAAVNRGN